VRTLTVRTERQSQLVDVTRLVQEAVGGEGGTAVLVYVPHTTAGVTINEHADPMVARDFEMALERIVPEDWGWQHIEEGRHRRDLLPLLLEEPVHELLGDEVALVTGRQRELLDLAGDPLLLVERELYR